MKIGFIGCGNMGEAILKGLLDNQKLFSENIFINTHSEITKNKLRENYGVNICKNNTEIINVSDVIFLAIKPFQFTDIANEIMNDINDADSKILISIMAGYKACEIYNCFENQNVKVAAAMPSIAAYVGESITGIEYSLNTEDVIKDYISSLFETIGSVYEVKDNEMHTITALAGAAPAYLSLILEAMADTGVKLGFSREKSYSIAAQSMLGTSKYIIETGIIPAKLKDKVCSAKGISIVGVEEAERTGLRNSINSILNKVYETSVLKEKNK